MRVTLVGIALWAGCGSVTEPEVTEPAPAPSEPDPTVPVEPTVPFEGKLPTFVVDPSLGWELHPNVESMVYVRWFQNVDGPAFVEYRLDGEWLVLPEVKASAGTNEQLIVGLPFDTNVDWRVTVGENVLSPDAPLRTGPLPKGAATPKVGLIRSRAVGFLARATTCSRASVEPNGGWGSSGPFWTVIFDRQGRPVWARRTPQRTWTLYAQVSTSGDHLLYRRVQLDERVRRGDCNSLLPRRGDRAHRHSRAPPRDDRAAQRHARLG